HTTASIGSAEPRGLLVSADGANVYAGNVVSDSVTTFSRNPVTGALTYVDRLDPGTQLEGPLALSPDGAFLYALGSVLTMFSRDLGTGALSLVGGLAEGADARDMLFN